MRTKSIKKNKINVVTLGCSKNIVDSEILMGQLKASGFNVTHESNNGHSNIIIINTCGFIDNAKQESINTILDFASAKDKKLIDKLYVTGCLSERYKDDLMKEIPQVDNWFGTQDLPRLLKTVGADYKHELIGERLLTSPSHFAYVKISEGCDRPCSFCAIPIMRGKHKSKPEQEILTEIKKLVKNGVREVILIAQDLTYWGVDINGKRTLAELLQKISDIENLEWIRLQYAFPSQFPEDVFQVIRERKNICKYLDIPLQHISDKMLKIMRRGITTQRTKDLIYQIRQEIPGVALRTTLITGHPGEDENDFEELLEFVESTRFERLGIFTYSHEEGTHSYSMDDSVPEEVKKMRAEKVMDLQQGISCELNDAKIGKTFKVLIDRKEKEYFIGRTEFDSPEVDNEVLIKAEGDYLRIGDFVNIRITSADDFDLYGVLAK
ncbi:MAG: ribosomal protein S12 methylthiotransferase RimO [Bacteroidetes bacterium RIFCSPLOWO2_02_FULL_36_8]|nr:MAG: ribosomal protein S12 methylthiotransferase RimO [Bacteroidetes bacterium RIFCSPLOWO2_02_FULL_36_8]OFY71560.1 MAG: ribosomal protein S12 methylthiotransferase RimO [Bacteroidetes bacterium RIFCSPLOWO2_12_FULL_37_12]